MFLRMWFDKGLGQPCESWGFNQYPSWYGWFSDANLSDWIDAFSPAFQWRLSVSVVRSNDPIMRVIRILYSGTFLKKWVRLCILYTAPKLLRGPYFFSNWVSGCTQFSFPIIFNHFRNGAPFSSLKVPTHVHASQSQEQAYEEHKTFEPRKGATITDRVLRTTQSSLPWSASSRVKHAKQCKVPAGDTP